MSTITWGNVKFDGPIPIQSWDGRGQPGVFAVMMRTDPLRNPEIYRLIYFSASDSRLDPESLHQHQKYHNWLSLAGSDQNMFVGVYEMPDATSEERRRLASELINYYRPACNR